MMHKEILEDIMKDSPCVKNGFCDEKEEHWCFLKELVKHWGLSDYQAEQIRLFYDYKYIESKEKKGDIGEERAFNEFIEKYGKKFHDVYKEGMKHDELFYKVFCEKQMPTDEQIRGDMKEK